MFNSPVILLISLLIMSLFPFENKTIRGLIVILVYALGFCGHCCLRKILHLRPSIEKMIVSNTLLPISLSVDILAFLGMLLMCLKLFLPDLTLILLTSYPKTACSLFTLNNSVAAMPLAVCISTLIIFKSLRQNAASIYNGLDHDLASLIFYISIPGFSCMAATIQVTSCGHLCK